MIKAQDLVLPSVAALAPYEPGKPIEELQRELGIVEPVKLASNENPLGPSPRAIEAIKAALPELNRYPDGASYELRKKIADFHKVGVERVFAASGSVEVPEPARIPVSPSGAWNSVYFGVLFVRDLSAGDGGRRRGASSRQDFRRICARSRRDGGVDRREHANRFSRQSE